MGKVLDSVTHHPYLGVELSRNLDWGQRVNNKVMKPIDHSDFSGETWAVVLREWKRQPTKPLWGLTWNTPAQFGTHTITIHFFFHTSPFFISTFRLLTLMFICLRPWSRFTVLEYWARDDPSAVGCCQSVIHCMLPAVLCDPPHGNGASDRKALARLNWSSHRDC